MPVKINPAITHDGPVVRDFWDVSVTPFDLSFVTLEMRKIP